MHEPITLLSLFLLGFLGGTHCVGMCGGLSSAFALQLPPHIQRIWLIILLNVGRIGSYVVIGALMGALSQIGSLLEHTRTVQLGLSLAANILLLLMGLYLAGIFSLASKIELLGRPIWRRLNPLLNRLLPIRSVSACLGVGILWGWLPCGLVYNASLYALGSGSAMQGALYLLAFGLGTLPNLLAAGIFAVQLKQILQHRMLRLGVGLLVSLWAIWQIIRVWLVFQAAF
ncbi:sulfite exporter TauE/SafE family protein [Wielerella bovis]|uniref:sulfite exporter TauE/SafE family protein n=1 Tax=Wielerella bovis TaxID=2917790 RepID=UPI002019EBD7|nr:sulfite exporter TauE/SafE family protein [Wielerella bovis]ULJ59339.1 sulfite exporter TauE/SafE family protein [Wielerella bovis]